MYGRYKFAKNDYEYSIWPIALVIYSDCYDHGDGIAEFWHGCENNFELPCDMLTRLGIMRPGPGYMTHKFISDWRPDAMMNPFRHRGEPSYRDLAAGLFFLVDWNVQLLNEFDQAEASKPLEELSDFDLSAKLPATADDRVQFKKFAVQTAAFQLVRLNLCSSLRGGGFQLNSAFTGYGLINEYRASRHEMMLRLGKKAHLYPPW